MKDSPVKNIANYPTAFGRCNSRDVGKVTDIEVKLYTGGELYTADEMLVSEDDLNIDMYTRENFGCNFHEALPNTWPVTDKENIYNLEELYYL